MVSLSWLPEKKESQLTHCPIYKGTICKGDLHTNSWEINYALVHIHKRTMNGKYCT